ncbi:hypothetical protein MANES_02G011751v8 [Manihot esculenta]|uniref:Uncharacterized protein n=1 Tax=Manihot esculenta TaxID=3983 RepID=A0ACB7I580_MANES|nr:hypothetical protein MANES_02G011751v8 [Manihot esculenta]
MVPLGAEANLILFQADIYNDNEFEPAIDGCESVFHVATPIHHGLESSQRLIYTATVLAASPLNEAGNGFNTCMDECCWTALHLFFSHGNDYFLLLSLRGFFLLKSNYLGSRHVYRTVLPSIQDRRQVRTLSI